MVVAVFKKQEGYFQLDDKRLHIHGGIVLVDSRAAVIASVRVKGV